MYFIVCVMSPQVSECLLNQGQSDDNLGVLGFSWGASISTVGSLLSNQNNLVHSSNPSTYQLKHPGGSPLNRRIFLTLFM